MADGEATFDEHYYRHDCGIPYERNDHWLGFFGDIASAIVRELAPASVLDVGCAMGFLVEALRARGVDAWGIDVSDFAIGQVHESAAKYCAVASATEDLPAHFPAAFDLVTCVEVVEHMPPEAAGAATGNLARWGRRVLFSSSPDDYAEATHLNVLPPEEWGAHFARHGMLRSFDTNVAFLTPWAVLYEHAVTAPPSIVARYERRLARYQRETLDLRGAIVRMQRALADIEGALDGQVRDAPFKSVHEAKTQIEQLRQRERDLQAEVDRLVATLQQQNSDVSVLHDNYYAAVRARDTAQDALAAAVLRADEHERGLGRALAREQELATLLDASEAHVKALRFDLERQGSATRGLEEQVTRMAPAQAQLDAMRESTSWRLGRTVVRPAAWARDVLLARRRNP